MNVLVVDIGGTHVKFRTELQEEPVKFNSGPDATPEEIVPEIREATSEWKYDRVSLGYPGLVIHNIPMTEPHNLGKGWVSFDYKKAFGGKPIRIVNDAAMQALGSYRGGRMLFLSLGTGLGSAMVVDGEVQDLALAHLLWNKGKTYEDFLSAAALEQKGPKVWSKRLREVIKNFQTIFKPEYIVLGGGNAKGAVGLSKKIVLGANASAFTGGFLLWDKAPVKMR